MGALILGIIQSMYTVPRLRLPFELGFLLAPMGSIVLSLIILAASRQIARFASRLAIGSDTAGNF